MDRIKTIKMNISFWGKIKFRINLTILPITPSCISRTILGFWIILVQMIFAIRYDVDLVFIIHYYLLIIFLLIMFLSSNFNLQKLNKLSEMLWIALCSSWEDYLFTGTFFLVLIVLILITIWIIAICSSWEDYITDCPMVIFRFPAEIERKYYGLPYGHLFDFRFVVRYYLLFNFNKHMIFFWKSDHI